jgi:hypothetical protein
MPPLQRIFRMSGAFPEFAGEFFPGALGGLEDFGVPFPELIQEPLNSLAFRRENEKADENEENSLENGQEQTNHSENEEEYSEHITKNAFQHGFSPAVRVWAVSRKM